MLLRAGMLVTCAQNAEHGDCATTQMCVQFVVAIVGCGDRGERVHGKVTQGYGHRVCNRGDVVCDTRHTHKT